MLDDASSIICRYIKRVPHPDEGVDDDHAEEHAEDLAGKGRRSS